MTDNEILKLHDESIAALQEMLEVQQAQSKVIDQIIERLKRLERRHL
jgi:hypothetical protein